MSKKKVIIETQTMFMLEGPEGTKGSAQIYLDWPITGEYNNPKDVGGEIWDWAQSHWDEFIPETHKFELGGAMVEGKLRWCCVLGVTDAKGKPVSFAETKWIPRKKTQKAQSWDSGAKKKKKKAPPKPKPKTRKEKALETSGVTDKDINVGGKITNKIKQALGD